MVLKPMNRWVMSECQTRGHKLSGANNGHAQFNDKKKNELLHITVCFPCQTR